jgi:hypothetical protein
MARILLSHLPCTLSSPVLHCPALSCRLSCGTKTTGWNTVLFFVCTMDSLLNTILVTTMAAAQLLSVINLDDTPTIFESRLEKKRKREQAPYKRNVSARLEMLETIFEPVHVLDDLMVNENHQYVKRTHMHSWNFSSLLII